MTPIVVKGGALKSRNQHFNKYKAKETSVLQQGEDPHNRHKNSPALDKLSMERDLFFRDYFYKIAHWICDTAIERGINTMVVGHNIDWKQNSPMWDKDNQNFVGIPFAKFISILKIVGLKSSINVVDFEESYTSKTSFIDNDFIPTYVKGDTEEHIFSGKRQKRGLYISKDGYKINADVNGSLNIIRKHFGDSAFNGIDRTSYAKKTIETLDFVDFYPQNCKRKKEACVKPKG